MTNEEAKRVLEFDLDHTYNDESKEALRIAIKALETIPKYKDAYGKGWDDGAKATYEHLKMCEEEQSGDLIDRQAVIDLISNFILEIPSESGRDLNAHTNDVLRQILRNVKSDRVLPPANPQEPKWIPVSERLPEKNMPCLVSAGKLCLTQIAIYSDLMGTIDHRIFYQGDYGHENFVDITQYVIAWMPLPKPYKAESEVNTWFHILPKE